MEALVGVTSTKAPAGVTKASVEVFVEAYVKVTSVEAFMEAFVKITSKEAFVGDFVEVISIETVVEKSSIGKLSRKLSCKLLLSRLP